MQILTGRSWKPSYWRVLAIIAAYMVSVAGWTIVLRQFGGTALLSLPLVCFFSLASAGAVAIAVTDKQTRQRAFVRDLSWFPLVIGVVAAGYAAYQAWLDQGSLATGVSDDFYSVSAQVIPILVLALTIDVRQSDILRSRDIATIIFVAVVGEGFALGATAFPVGVGPLDFPYFLVVGCIVTLGTALCMALAAGPR